MRACLRLIAQVNFAVCLLIVAGSISTVALAEPPMTGGRDCVTCCSCTKDDQTCDNPGVASGCTGFPCNCSCDQVSMTVWLCHAHN
ncbi:MAG: hypothetical protein SFX72_07855 [Isosphaeraceae bacterium]|nr:hypothetical protein [Isosphaeraceae bacterium]